MPRAAAEAALRVLLAHDEAAQAPDLVMNLQRARLAVEKRIQYAGLRSIKAIALVGRVTRPDVGWCARHNVKNSRRPRRLGLGLGYVVIFSGTLGRWSRGARLAPWISAAAWTGEPELTTNDEQTQSA